MGHEQLSSDIFQVGNRPKSPKKYPGLKKIPTEQEMYQKRERDALRSEMGNAEKQKIEYMKFSRDIITGEQYAGTPLQILPIVDKKDAFIMGNSIGAIVISIDQLDDEDDEIERKDSLKKDGDFSHTNIKSTIIFPTGEKMVVSEGEDLKSIIKTSAEFLKQAERIKYPENFGYKKMFFKQNDFGMVKLMGISLSGKEFILPFFGKNSFSTSNNAPTDAFHRETYAMILKYLEIPQGENI